MGSMESRATNNEQLVNYLVDEKRITSKQIEKVFRIVDRGFFIDSGNAHRIYGESAWKSGNLHLSSPVIYAEALRALNIQERNSFLNIGSGTGYFSTMVGLLLGPHGMNHGIELYSDVVDYAHQKINKFFQNYNALDVFEFCQPKFIVGNAFDLNIEEKKYDRIYCGAQCPDVFFNLIKKCLKVNGILVLPYETKFLKVIRIGENDWTQSLLLRVSFAPLQSEHDCINNTGLISILSQPSGLQSLCRGRIRHILRHLVEFENFDLSHYPPARKVTTRRLPSLPQINLISLFNNVDEDELLESSSDFDDDMSAADTSWEVYSSTSEESDAEVESDDGQSSNAVETAQARSEKEAFVDDDSSSVTEAIIAATNQENNKNVNTTESCSSTKTNIPTPANTINTIASHRLNFINSLQCNSSVSPMTSQSLLLNKNENKRSFHELLCTEESLPSTSTSGCNSSNNSQSGSTNKLNDYYSDTERVLKQLDLDYLLETDENVTSKTINQPKRHKLDSGFSEEDRFNNDDEFEENQRLYTVENVNEEMGAEQSLGRQPPSTADPLRNLIATYEMVDVDHDVQSHNEENSSYDNSESEVDFEDDINEDELSSENDMKIPSTDEIYAMTFRKLLEKKIVQLSLPNRIKRYLNFDRDFMET